MNEMEADRFFAKVDADGDCWQWVGSDNGHGYGAVRIGGQQQRAHRVAWEHLIGPIPEGLVLDHLCRNKRCVNPDHLEPVTIGENVLRGYGITAEAARKTHCSEGHELSGKNLIEWGRAGGRRCRACTQPAKDAQRKRLAAEFLAGRGSTKHGTLTGYTFGCRCEACRSARREYVAARAVRAGAGR